jgi:hypothetical protein
LQRERERAADGRESLLDHRSVERTFVRARRPFRIERRDPFGDEFQPRRIHFGRAQLWHPAVAEFRHAVEQSGRGGRTGRDEPRLVETEVALQRRMVDQAFIVGREAGAHVERGCGATALLMAGRAVHVKIVARAAVERLTAAQRHGQGIRVLLLRRGQRGGIHEVTQPLEVAERTDPGVAELRGVKPEHEAGARIVAEQALRTRGEAPRLPM